MKHIWLILGLVLLAGCQPSKDPLIGLQGSDSKGTTNIHKEPKPLYREFTDEFGVRKGWDF